MGQQMRTGSSPVELPDWRSVLAVVAHPDDETFGLGAVLDFFAQAGARTAVLCLTHGEASTLREPIDDLAAIRGQEFALAARRLGVGRTWLCDYPDGTLSQWCTGRLTGEVLDAVRAVAAEGLLVFDPGGVTGHPDHSAATRAALLAATGLDLPVLGWTIPAAVAAQLNSEFGTRFAGHEPAAIDITLPVRRGRQLAAANAHTSQAIPTSPLWRRLELLGNHESLRWLARVCDEGRGPCKRDRNAEG